MKSIAKTKKQLVQELGATHQRIAELEQSEQLLGALFISLPIGIYIVQDRKFQFVSSQFQQSSGYSEDELIGTDPLELVFYEDRHMVRENAIKMLRGKTASPYEYRLVAKGGAIRWSMETVASVRYHGRQATLGNFMDITQRKQAEEALKRSEEFRSSLLENSPNPILVVNPDTSIRYVNPALEKLTGFTSAEVTGRKAPYPWWPEERRNEIGARLDKLIAGGSKKVGELILQKKNGERFWVAINSAPVTYEGTLKYFLLNWLDITEPKQMEASIRKAVEEWRTTFDSINDWVSIHSRDFKFVRVNKSLANAFDKNPKEIIGQHCYQFLHGGTKPITNCPHIRALESKKPAKEEVYLRNRGIYAEISVSPIFDDEGEIVGTVHITKDITEHKQAEEKLRQIDRMKTEFLSNVSHELRTPLQSISGFAKLIYRGQVPDDETRQEFLQIIDSESQHLGNLINSLLDMSRLESGRFEINKQALPIRDTIIDAVKSFHGLARDKNIVLNEDIPAELPEIEADAERLRQVVINLLGNAIKFSDPGSSVTVKAESRNGELLFQVTDQGIGIPQEAMPHLFERYYQAENKLARGGTGLGLYISKQIIEAHGGHIWAESRVGEGSTFRFTLPLNGKGGDAHG